MRSGAKPGTSHNGMGVNPPTLALAWIVVLDILHVQFKHNYEIAEITNQALGST